MPGDGSAQPDLDVVGMRTEHEQVDWLHPRYLEADATAASTWPMKSLNARC